MEINRLETVKVDVKTLEICVKVSDRFSAQLVSSTGNVILEQEDGYVPNYMPGDNYGDYIILNMDIDTGLVTNWEKPTQESLESWIKNED